ncbi:MAG: hypothetical protein EBS61_12380, partial [Betaproteobacteria bacterium]|nr:hypothetical protein [Betaproteobacteria bacterium]
TVHKEDLSWLIYFLAGGKLPRSIRSGVLREAAIQASGLPAWLFEACYAHAGDLAETIAYCLDHAGLGHADLEHAVVIDTKDVIIPNHHSNHVEVREQKSSTLKPSLHDWLEKQAIPMTQQSAQVQIQWLINQWRAYPAKVRFAMNKIMTGGFRLGVSRAMVLRALAEASGLSAQLLAQRFMGWTGHLPRFAWPKVLTRTTWPWAMLEAGRPNGNGTVSGCNGLQARRKAICGRVAKS